MSSLLTPAAPSSSSTSSPVQSRPLSHGASASGSCLPGLNHSPSPDAGEDGFGTPAAPNTGSEDSSEQSEGDGPGKKLLNPFAEEFVPGSGGLPRRQQQRVNKYESGPAGVLQPKGLEVSGSTSSDDGVAADEAGTSNPRSNSAPYSGGLSTAFAGNVKGGRGRRGSSAGLRAPANSVEARGSLQTPAGSSAGRRGQMTNANHLLNFQYDPIHRPPPRAPPVQRAKQKRTQPYNKELFLQANFRFLVSDLGDYVENASDPDKMLEWDDVAAVHVLAPQPLQCPICLESPPVTPQITSCGHTFCFPCILRYMMMGEENPRGEYYKKCPLCFAMISCKDMRTVTVQNVKQYGIGDTLKFTLLARAKDSIIPFERDGAVRSSISYSRDGYCHGFSKFSLTSDAEQTSSKALSELKEWMEKVQSEGSNEDLELLPYGLVATEQVQQRKAAWEDHRATEFLSCSPNARQRILAQAKIWENGTKAVDGLVAKRLDVLGQQGKGEEKTRVDVLAETEAALTELKEKASWVYESAFSDDDDDDGKSKIHGFKGQQGNVSGWEDLLIAHERDTTEVMHGRDPDHKKDSEDNDLYYFYQAADGQPLILHPLNMKCLMQHYGGYESLPSSMEAKVLELEPVTQTEATRKRYRYLSHLPLTTVFQMCEVDLRDQLPVSAFEPFLEEIRGRHNRRQRRRKMETEQKAEEQRRASIVVARLQRPPSAAEFVPVLKLAIEDDLAASSVGYDGPLVSSSVISPSPDDRKLFSRVAKLGFASGHDAPTLQTRSPDSPVAWGSPPVTGTNAGASSSAAPLTFAAMIQAQAMAKSTEKAAEKSVGFPSSKKGKKAAKVILSTAGGRRY